MKIATLIPALGCFLASFQLSEAFESQTYVIEWGWNSATASPVPAKQILSNAIAVSAGAFHALALRGDGTVAAWGDNSLGEAVGEKTVDRGVTNGTVRINGRTLSNVVAVAADREFSLALQEDGTAITWGRNSIPKGVGKLKAIAAEWGHSWGVREDGTVVGWASELSNQTYGQLLPVRNLSNVVAIAVGPGGHGTRGLALKKDGTVTNWGSETDHEDATPPGGLRTVIAIAAGGNHSLALKSDGTVIGWGFNNVGQATGIPSTNSPAISAGQVKIGEQVLSNIVAIAASRGFSMALRQDGRVVAWGRMINDLYPATVPHGLSNVVAIAAGESFCLAITTNSAVADQFRR